MSVCNITVAINGRSIVASVTCKGRTGGDYYLYTCLLCLDVEQWKWLSSLLQEVQRQTLPPLCKLRMFTPHHYTVLHTTVV